MNDLIQTLDALTYDFTRRLVEELRRALLEQEEGAAPAPGARLKQTKPKASSKPAPRVKVSTLGEVRHAREELLARAVEVLKGGPLSSNQLRGALELPRPVFQKAMAFGVETGQVVKSGDRNKTTYGLVE